MSEILKTEAIVLNKLNYGDTSIIVSLYTKEFGKISAIIKGGRNPKSKLALVVDPLNIVQIVLYKKDTREIQVISSADLVSHYPKLKEDLEKLKYGYAVIELLKKLTVENEANTKLFRGTERILSLIEASEELPVVLFTKFFIFFLKEFGYDFILNECAVCGKSIKDKYNLAYSFELGILCENCSRNYSFIHSLEVELFNYLLCLKNNKNFSGISSSTMDKAVIFLEKFLKYHIPDFKSFQSFQLFNTR